MVDQLGVVYGGVLILSGLFAYFRGRSALALLLSIVFGAWSAYNATHPTRQNNVANLAIAAVTGLFLLLRFLTGGRMFPALLVIALSGAQVYKNYPYLK